MKNIVLIDLEKISLSANRLRHYVENNQMVYLFNLAGQFHASLEDMTELSGWISSGLVALLDTPLVASKRSQYALLAGQLQALLEEDTHIELFSSKSSIGQLIELLDHCGHKVHHHDILKQSKISLPVAALPLNEEQSADLLEQVRAYAQQITDDWPVELVQLQTSIAQTLALSVERTAALIEFLLQLKIIKIKKQAVRLNKKKLKQYLHINAAPAAEPVQALESQILNLSEQQLKQMKAQVVVGDIDSIMQFLQQQTPNNEGPFPPELDQLQWQVLQKLDELQDQRPKDIFSLRDQLQLWFPKADVQLLLKALIDKGYIQLNNGQLQYSMHMWIH